MAKQLPKDGEPQVTGETLKTAENRIAMQFASWTADALEQYIMLAKENATTLKEKSTLVSLLDDVKWLRTETGKISDPSDL